MLAQLIRSLTANFKVPGFDSWLGHGVEYIIIIMSANQHRLELAN